MSVRKAIARNTAFNAAGRLWEFAASILLLAYVVRRIGPAEYGSWALVGPFIGYAALLDIGLASGFAKHVAERAARKDDAGLSAVVTAGFTYYLLAGTLLVGLGWPLVSVLLQFLGRYTSLDASVTGDLAFLFRGGLVVLAVSNAMTAFTAIQTGLQRMGITNAISFAASLVKISATVVFIEAGFGVRGLLCAEGLSTAVFGIASIVTAFLLCPGLRVGPRHLSRSVFNQLFHFGWRSQVARLSNLIMFQTDKVLIGVYCAAAGIPAPRAQIGLYDLGISMASKLRSGPTVLTSALLPAASHLDALEKHDRIAELYLRSTKYLAVCAVPALLFGAANCQLIMRAWMGPGFDTAGWVLLIMSIGTLANVLPGAGVSIVLGQGRADWIMRAGVISMGANVILTVVFMFTIGFWGIPLATVLSMAISWAWFAQKAKPTLGIGMGMLLRRAVYWPVMASLPGIMLSVACDGYAATTSGPLPQLAMLAISAGLFLFTYGVLLSVMPFFDRRDNELLCTTLPIERIPGLTGWLAFATARGTLGERLRAFAQSRGRGYPDWLIRYRPIVSQLERSLGRNACVLEIGANENGYARFARRPVIAVDVAIAHLRAARAVQPVLPVVADIGALPFRDGAFDAVVCMDTFEHIPSSARRWALEEIHRTLAAAGTAAIGFPSGAGAGEAEATIRAAYRSYTGGTIRWLEEHAEHGLPDGDAIAEQAREATGTARRVHSTGNTNLHAWKWMWRIMMCGWPGRGNALAQAALHLATPVLCRMHRAPCYRTIVWMEPRDE